MLQSRTSLTLRILLRRIGIASLAPALWLGGSSILAAQDAVPPPIPNPGFEDADGAGFPVGWSLPGTRAGYRALIDRTHPHQGNASVRLYKNPESAVIEAQPFGTLMSTVDAAPYRGKRIRFSAAVRVPAGQSSLVSLWLREDRTNARGFFVSTQDDPITHSDWQVHTLEGDVAPDAASLNFGLILAGDGEAWMDSASIEIIGEAHAVAAPASAAPVRPRTEAGPHDAAARALTRQGLSNLEAFARAYGYVRFFHPSDQAAAADWNRIAIDGVDRAERARDARELAAALNATLQPVAPTFRAEPTAAARPYPAPAAPRTGAEALAWQRRGYSDGGDDLYVQRRVAAASFTDADILTAALPGRVTIHVPLKVWTDAQGRTLPAAAPIAPASSRPADYVPSGFDRSTRLAATIVAWNAMRHFYPYWDAVPDARWPAALDEALRGAAIDADDLAFENRLRRLMAMSHDGHGSVRYWRAPQGMLPLDWAWVEGRLVVTAAGANAGGLGRGDIVTRIAGRTVGAALADASALNPGSEHWSRWRALHEWLSGPAGSALELTFTDAAGATRTVRLPYQPVSRAADVVREARRDPVSEIEPGILYVDLTRLPQDRLVAALSRMAGARGLIFDLRGYPRGQIDYLSHLAGGTIRSADFEAPLWTRPDQVGAQFSNFGWEIPAQSPRFTDDVVFITDESAISYAESVLGTVKGNRLARIVGAPTAGANGNVASMALPGGYTIMWTGMRVRNRDGSQHHLNGVAPDVPVSRTVAGIRAGRDELLERALQEARANMAAR